jgi:hypothetical protein
MAASSRSRHRSSAQGVAGAVFEQSVQRPQIVGVLAGPAQCAVETEIGAINGLRLVDPPLLEE